jgi:hypothetical protein
MTCSNSKDGAVHSKLCEVHYPYVRIAPSNDVIATRQRDCTLGSTKPPGSKILGFEAKMDLISIDEFIAFMPVTAKFGTYCNLSKREHFCVDNGRRTVDGRRLSWLWVFPNGDVRPSSKKMADKPTLIWTKDQIAKAYNDARNPTLPMWTRHVEIFSELAITFCLPAPK